MSDRIAVDLARVEQRLGNLVMQIIGYEQRIAELEAENARLQAQMATREGADGGSGGA